MRPVHSTERSAQMTHARSVDRPGRSNGLGSGPIRSIRSSHQEDRVPARVAAGPKCRPTEARRGRDCREGFGTRREQRSIVPSVAEDLDHPDVARGRVAWHRCVGPRIACRPHGSRPRPPRRRRRRSGRPRCGGHPVRASGLERSRRPGPSDARSRARAGRGGARSRTGVPSGRARLGARFPERSRRDHESIEVAYDAGFDPPTVPGDMIDPRPTRPPGLDRRRPGRLQSRSIRASARDRVRRLQRRRSSAPDHVDHRSTAALVSRHACDGWRSARAPQSSGTSRARSPWLDRARSQPTGFGGSFTRSESQSTSAGPRCRTTPPVEMRSPAWDLDSDEVAERAADHGPIASDWSAQ